MLPSRFGAGQLIVLLSAVLIVTGAMAARDLSPRLASAAALVISLLIAFLTWFYYHLNVSPPVVAGYGLYVGAACAPAALACSVWALAAALLGARAGHGASEPFSGSAAIATEPENGCGYSASTVVGWMDLAAPPWVTSTRRGLARSASGIVTVSTPFS